MELKKYVGKGAIGLMLIAIGGCYEYPPPASGTLGETYTQRPRGDADKLLEGISDLTLADAQRIAVINNPTYIAAAHAVSAARMRYYQAMGFESAADRPLLHLHRNQRQLAGLRQPGP